MGKNKKFAMIVLALALSLSAHAQVFMIDGDKNYRTPEDPSVFATLPGEYGAAVDYYTPIGDGMLLLAALGGAYLLGKRRKQQ